MNDKILRTASTNAKFNNIAQLFFDNNEDDSHDASFKSSDTEDTAADDQKGS
jgi:hypothetical protein